MFSWHFTITPKRSDLTTVDILDISGSEPVILIAGATVTKGYAWTTNLTGRITEVVTPALIGVLIYFVGISWSISVVAIGPILGAALVMKYAPETRGLTLEQIQEELDLEGELSPG